MIKKVTGVICIISILCIISIFTIVYANNQVEKQNLLKTIDENNQKIAQINEAQDSLHLTAEIIRSIDSEDEFLTQMSNKWTEFENLEQSLVSDNITFQKKVDKINKLAKYVKPTKTTTEIQNIDSTGNKTYIGEFTCVAYSGDGITSTGVKPKVGRTIAVDPKVIPYGSKVYIEGIGTRIAEDCGGGIKGKMIDIFMSSNAECIKHGRRKLKVYLIK